MCDECQYAPELEFEESYDAPVEGLGVSRSFYLLPEDRYSSPRPIGELSKREVGLLGEEFAAKFLEDEGFDILERNWRCRRGEADIVAESPEGALTFVEVKTRRCVNSFTDCAPEEAVGTEKQARYAKLAEIYLAEHSLNMPVCVDIVSIILGDDGRARLRLITGSIFIDL